ncbi:MAG: CotH kinase family protein [Myxococcota bacterium]|nr:CotH kinase family protein [Myxococcota bacterium]
MGPVCALHLVLVVGGCTGSGAVEAPSGDEADVDGGGTDSGGSGSGGSGGSGGGDGADDLPSAELMPVFSQNGGAFIDSLTVRFSSADGLGEVHACVADPDESCDPEAVGEQVTLSRSAVVHAQVNYGGAQGPIVARSFHELDEELEDWDSNLPVMIFWTDADADDLWENTAMGLSLLGPEAGRTSLLGAAQDSGRARLRIRGSSSSNLDKKAFDLELWDADDDGDRNVPLLGMPKNADWVLYAPYYWDDALVRNPLACQLSRDIGRYASRTRFVEVFLAVRDRPLDAGDYLGLYVLMEEIEQGDDRVDVKQLDEGDLDEPDISGGYVFKRDRAGSGDVQIWSGSAEGRITFRQPIIMVDPESGDMPDAQLDWISDELDAMGWALVDGMAPDGRRYDDILDVGSFIDHHIINIYFKNPDAFRLSGYFHKDRDDKIHAGPVWDFDRTAGSIDSRARDPLHWDATNFTGDTTPMFTYGWYGPLFDDPVFRARYWSRMEQLLDGELSLESTLAHIDAYASQLSEAGERNEARWGVPEFAEEIESLQDWFRLRHEWMSTCVRTAADPRTCRG